MRLQDEPFVEDQRIGGMGAREGLERMFARLSRRQGKNGKGGETFGHVVGAGQLALGALCALLRLAGGEHRQRHIAQGAPSGACRVGTKMGAAAETVVKPRQPGRMGAAERPAQGFARRENRVGIDILRHLARDVPFAGQAQRLGGESRIETTRLGFLKDRAISLDEFGADLRRLARPYRRDRSEQQSRRQTLHRLPAIETVAIVARQDQQIALGQIVVDPHRRGKSAQQGEGRTARDAGKDDAPRRARQFQDSAGQFAARWRRSRQASISAPDASIRPSAMGIVKGSFTA